jgi:hypothetical protein
VFGVLSHLTVRNFAVEVTWEPVNTQNKGPPQRLNICDRRHTAAGDAALNAGRLTGTGSQAVPTCPFGADGFAEKAKR